MKKTATLMVLSFLLLPAAQAADSCKITKLGGLGPKKIEGWEVSVAKEDKRNKPGDALVLVETASGKRCEATLDSWGTELYAAKSSRLLIVVEQGDAGDGQLTWVDPASCKPLKSVRAAGRVKLSATAADFSGGKDGPAVIAPTRFTLGPDCLPNE